MSDPAPRFEPSELIRRQQALRARMEEDGLAAIVVSAPENSYYLSGYHTKSVSTLQFLLFPRDGAPQLFTRQMEAVNARDACSGGGLGGFDLYQDDEDPLERACDFLRGRLGRGARVGLELGNATMPALRAGVIAADVPGVDWVDVTGLIDRMRLVKSPAELAALREAGRIGDLIADEAVATVAPGRTENDLAAVALAGLPRHGSEYPGSWPNILAGRRTGLIHAAWEGTPIGANDHVIMEITGVRLRYHAPSMRTVLVGSPDAAIARAAEVLARAQEAAVAAIEPGAPARVVNQASERVIAAADPGCRVARRSGYSLGIGFPPTWGAQWQLGLNSVLDETLQVGMTFHVVVVGHLPDGRAVSIGCSVAVEDGGPARLTRGGVFHA